MNPCITIEREGDVAVILINNPPVNAGSLEVRSGLLEALNIVTLEPELMGAVIIGKGGFFIAGSDLSEFGKPLQEPQLPVVIEAIECCNKPVVAALHGAALGGGFELALGCDARIATEKTIVGLPEVTLGMIPGAGGTQRLPRLIGIPKAIEMICSGERIKAPEALDLGIVDAVVDGDLRSAAITFVREMKGKRRVRDLPIPPAGEIAVNDAARRALKLGKNRPQIHAAIKTIVDSTLLPVDEALASERAIFQRLRLTDEAFAARHLFFAEREAAKLGNISNVSPRCITTVAVVGAGTMGSGIALAILQAGLDVVLLEQSEGALVSGVGRIKEHYSQRVADGRMQQKQANVALAQLRPTTDWTQISRAQLVIEAVFEDLAVKQDLLRRVEPLLGAEVIFATNTSYLDVDAIAEVAQRPQNVIGLHYFSPANVMRLVEVVRGMYSSSEAIATGFALVRRLGKLPILANNAFGFIGNRIYAACRRQCELMLEEGALPAEIDAAMESFGFAMGPFAVADLSGLDIAWRMRQARATQRDPRARYVEIPDRLCEMNRLGRKTGAGYYRYSGKTRSEDRQVTALIEQISASKAITRQPFSREAIVERVLLTMANEAALLLTEGVTTRVGDVDLVLVHGFGFPKWEGGPSFWASRQPLAHLKRRQQELARVTGHGFVKGDLALFHHMHNRQSISATA
ncbi:3-hydroxyacyl-CoA dehydrogenase NAD-binding domain-containing protein [Pseudomonas saliphila]|uniref:3-hydroxyacyl-CoA dehydrogenase NAD-binding domain-containing protein n=1 Tax=Pseudomonas saliphila TaxID=2586906 RepID=UPI00123BC92C|nr:3-hydroxyacyl-CoA dehydrogenase NAD-binding domain-containing protein [Pseudomonas saliphila]